MKQISKRIKVSEIDRIHIRYTVQEIGGTSSYISKCGNITSVNKTHFQIELNLSPGNRYVANHMMSSVTVAIINKQDEIVCELTAREKRTKAVLEILNEIFQISERLKIKFNKFKWTTTIAKDYKKFEFGGTSYSKHYNYVNFRKKNLFYICSDEEEDWYDDDEKENTEKSLTK